MRKNFTLKFQVKKKIQKLAKKIVLELQLTILMKLNILMVLYNFTSIIKAKIKKEQLEAFYSVN